MNMRILLIGCTLSLLFAAGGCVERTLSIDSNPQGAMVVLDDEEIGRTPLRHDFQWYAKYEVIIRKDGYQTLKTTADVKAPIYEIPPLDLVADVLPIPFKDKQQFTYDLQLEPDTVNAPALLQRGEDMREQLEGSHIHPTTAATATTMPAQ
jgi:hypothetical protein